MPTKVKVGPTTTLSTCFVPFCSETSPSFCRSFRFRRRATRSFIIRLGLNETFPLSRLYAEEGRFRCSVTELNRRALKISRFCVRTFLGDERAVMGEASFEVDGRDENDCLGCS